GLRILEAIVAKEPAKIERREDIASDHDRIASVLRAQGDASGALKEARISVAIRQELASRDLHNPKRQWRLALGRKGLADGLLRPETQLLRWSSTEARSTR